MISELVKLINTNVKKPLDLLISDKTTEIKDRIDSKITGLTTHVTTKATDVSSNVNSKISALTTHVTTKATEVTNNVNSKVSGLTTALTTARDNIKTEVNASREKQYDFDAISHSCCMLYLSWDDFLGNTDYDKSVRTSTYKFTTSWNYNGHLLTSANHKYANYISFEASAFYRTKVRSFILYPKRGTNPKNVNNGKQIRMIDPVNGNTLSGMISGFFVPVYQIPITVYNSENNNPITGIVTAIHICIHSADVFSVRIYTDITFRKIQKSDGNFNFYFGSDRPEFYTHWLDRIIPCWRITTDTFVSSVPD